MFEDSKEYEISNQDPFCRTFSKNTLLQDSETNAREERCKVVEATHIAILDELIDDAILELCFETHRAAKLSFSVPADYTPIPEKLTQSSGKSAKATTKSGYCFICGLSKGPNKFASHLVSCMNGLKGHEAGRKARTKMINFKEYDSEDEDLDDPDLPKKTKRNKKASARGKQKFLGNALSKPAYNSTPSYMDMSYDEKKAFLFSKCGVVSRRTKKMCQNTRNCVVHTEIERTNVRCDLLREMGDDSDNGHIDIDTVEDISDIVPSYSAGEGSISNISAYTSGSSAFP